MTNPVQSDQFGSIQDAVDYAISVRSPLIIVPGVHTIFSPIEIRGAVNLEILNAGEIRPATNMTAVFDVAGSSDFSLRGGKIVIPTGVEVESGVWIYSDTNVTATLTKRPYVGNVRISQEGTGNFLAGLRIGIEDNTLQCDEGYFERIAVRGLYGASDYGVRFEGGFGNNFNHTLIGSYVYDCDVAYSVWKVNDVTLLGNTGDGGQPGSGGGSAAFQISSLNTAVIGGRFEEYNRALTSGGAAQTGVSNVILQNIRFAVDENVEQDFIDWGYAGQLALNGITCYILAESEHENGPRIRLRTSQICVLSGQFTVGSDGVRADSEGVITGNAAGGIRYIQASSSLGFVSQEYINLD